MIGRTNASSGGGISGNRAVLVARIPSGSTVTATKGGVTLTPMMWVSETYPDQDIGLFVFSSAQFDATTPWTITATDGTNTASDTVLITTNKEYEVELAYYLSLFDRTKDSFATISSGFQMNSYLSLSDYSASYVRFTASGDNNPRGSWKTPLPDDLSQYSTLDICVYGSNDPRNKVGVTSAIVTDYSDTWIASHSIPTNEGSVVQIPVTSSMAGKYFSIRQNSGKTFYIQYVRLVRVR